MTSDAAQREPDPPEATALVRLDVCLDACVNVPAGAALVVDTDEAIPPDPTPPFDLCGHCGGPVYFCNGDGCQRAGVLALDTAGLLWLTASRALLLGTLLSRNVGSGYGGVLLLAARAMVGATVAPPSERLAELLPHPGYDVSRGAAAELAAAYLHDGDLGALSRLSASLRTTNDALLWRRRREAEKAALSLPWQGGRYALIAVVCDACAGGRALADDVRGASIPWARRLEAAATYDAAIRCPACHALHGHPLPGLPIGQPHPVTRCTGGLAGDVERCMVHGEALGPDGVCGVGRPVLDQARAWASDRPTIRLPWQRDLARALVQAQRVELERRIASGDFVKQIVGSAELRPFFAAAASLSPEMASGLAQITGEPFRAEDADPEAIAFLGALGPFLQGLARAGGAVTRLLRGGRKPRTRRASRRLPGGSR
jgi:hypothetical protein